MNLQPNFEIIKKAVFNTLRQSNEVEFYIIYNNIITNYKNREYHPVATDKKFKELNKLLDNIDIRSVGNIIDVIIEKKKVQLPKWIEHKQFNINYNVNNVLDLIKIF